MSNLRLAAFPFVMAAYLAVTPAAAQSAPQPDWAAALRADATALHDSILENHPGVHDPSNSRFREAVEVGLVVALSRAEATTDLGGYWWAMREYAAGFDDGHLQVVMADQTTDLPQRWPGFITAWRGDRQEVISVLADIPELPPIGATLVGCEGRDAETVALETAGRFEGRWFLRAQRETYGSRVFLNASNPWRSEPRVCEFSLDGMRSDFELKWCPIDSAEAAARLNAANPARPIEFGFRRLDDGGYWIAMPAFDGSPEGSAYPALTQILESVRTQRADLQAAPYVVLDVRGNGGGSSHWGDELADLIWGEPWMETHRPPEIEAIDWRVSATNLATVKGYLDRWLRAGEDGERVAWIRSVIAGLETAQAAGEPIWREESDNEDDRSAPASAPVNAARARIFVLTDAVCASACLDSVDLWKAAGAVQIGAETNADTLYMEVRGQVLPSGAAYAGVPMKVWRGRARGANEPQRPRVEIDTTLSEAALRRRVSEIAREPI